MKNLFKLASVATLATFAFSCSQSGEPTIKTTTISFETSEGLLDFNGDAITLGDIQLDGATFSDVYWAKDFAVQGDTQDYNGNDVTATWYDGILFTTANNQVKFGSYYTNYDDSNSFDTWNGIVISANYNNETEPSQWGDYSQQFCVYATSGAENSSNFAACYYTDTDWAGTYSIPTIEFATSAKPQSIYLANSTYTASFSHSVEFTVAISGSLNGVEGQSVRFTLVDSEGVAVEDWTKIDLTSLGEVDTITLSVECEDWNAPTYFCFDNLEFI